MQPCVLVALNSTKLLVPHVDIIARSSLTASTCLCREFLVSCDEIGFLDENALWSVLSCAKLWTGHVVIPNKSLEHSIKVYCEDPEEIEKVWTDVAHHLLDYNYTLPLDDRKDVAKRVKDFYMGEGAKIGKSTFFNFTKIFSDRHFVDGSEVAAKLHSAASNSPVYVYYFNYQSPNRSSSAFYCAKGDIGGIAHAADAINCLGFNFTKYMSRSDKRMKERCHQMHSSFAKTGVPAFFNTIWKPTSGENLIYLNISGPDDMKMEESKSLCHSDFWRDFGLAENEKDVFPNVNRK